MLCCTVEVISDQQSRAASLKQRTDRVQSMSESDVSQLRADIKVLRARDVVSVLNVSVL